MSGTFHLLISVVLLTGGMCQGIAFPVNLGRFGNSFALFLGVQPADIFLYVFLPPILFDAAVRIDFYVFKKVAFPSSSIAVDCTLSYCSDCTVPLLSMLHSAKSHAWAEHQPWSM